MTQAGDKVVRMLEPDNPLAGKVDASPGVAAQITEN
jgi:hypothetical protein